MTSADTVRKMRGYHRMQSPLPLLCFLLILIPTTQSIDFGRSPCEEERYKAVFGGGFLPSCSPQGLFEPVQCKDDECWCVVKDTGEEIAGTRIKSPEIPNCDYPAIAANEADLIKAVIKNKGDDIVLTPDSFNGVPSYEFQSSSSVYAMSKDYLPPSLWSDFSILATIKPQSLEGGFLFAVVDYLESGIQFGLGISPGSNEYTQHIDLWYSEDAAEKGSTKIAQFTVPVMMGRWSRFAIGVNGTSINLHLYCQQNYAREEYKRSYSRLKFMEDSYLLVGHGGDIFNEQFKGQIQELRITNDPSDAEKQCEAKEKDSDEQLPGMEAEFGSGAYQPELGILDPDSEPDLPDEGSGALPEFMGKTIRGFDPNAAVISSTMMPADPVAATESPYGTPRPAVDVTTIADINYTSTVLPRTVDVDGEPGFDPLAIPGVPGEQGEPGEKGDKGDIGAPGIAHVSLPPPPTPPPPFPSTQSSSGEKGDKGDAGLQGMPGQRGVNGIPGLEGPIGPPGLRGEKGEKGEVGVGEPGTPGLPGQSTKGEPGADGMKGEQGLEGRSIQGPPGLPGSSFFAELEDLMIEGSGEEMGEEIFTQIPALRHLVGEKGEPGNCTMLEGLPGREGLDGADGTPGLPGAPGPRGQAGERGTVGIQGPRGEDGAEGRMGEAGVKGDKGSAGERGAQGLQGPPGLPAVLATADGSQGGAAGKPGTPGQDGAAGEQGERGEKGEKGISGEKGSRGFDGQEGPQGVAGLDGVQGEPGLPGATGAQGPRGEAGAQGAKGDSGVGLPGPPGPPGVISTTGKPFFGNLVASSRDSGAKGAKGEPGATGSVSVNDIENILPMFTEKGDKGDEGDRGKDGGCKMCVGFKGQRGPRGRRGKPGKPGLEGPKGSIGTIGLPGSNGIPGTPGSPGVSVKGERGDTSQCDCSAAQGSKGAKGEPGMVMSGSGAAANLVQGPPGPPGPPGESTAGPAGPPGPRGYPGRAGNGRPSSGGSSIGNVVMFATQHIMSSSSLAIPSGTLGFVMDQQRLYIRVNLGWQALSLGPVIPMTDGEFANEIPDFLGEFGNSGLKDQAAATGTEDFTGVLRIYALNEPLSGSEVVGVGGADHMCYKQAKRARVSGTYRAVLTSRLQRIDSLVFEKDRDLSIVNSRGERILDSWSGVTRNKGLWVQGVPIYSFDGKNIHKDDLWNQKYFWHGARSSGEADTDAYCEAWTSGDRSELGLTSSYMSGQVLDKSMHTCDSKLAVLCIETTVHETYRQR